LANDWITDPNNSGDINNENLKKLLAKIAGVKRDTGGVHIRNVQTGNLEFVS